MKACQVSGLAAAVLAGRDQSPSKTSILAGLGRVPAFRDAFLRADPEVLDKLLNRANSSPLGGQEIEVWIQPYNPPQIEKLTISRHSSRLYQFSPSRYHNTLVCQIRHLLSSRYCLKVSSHVQISSGCARFIR